MNKCFKWVDKNLKKNRRLNRAFKSSLERDVWGAIQALNLNLWSYWFGALCCRIFTKRGVFSAQSVSSNCVVLTDLYETRRDLGDTSPWGEPVLSDSLCLPLTMFIGHRAPSWLRTRGQALSAGLHKTLTRQRSCSSELSAPDSCSLGHSKRHAVVAAVQPGTPSTSSSPAELHGTKMNEWQQWNLLALGHPHLPALHPVVWAVNNPCSPSSAHKTFPLFQIGIFTQYFICFSLQKSFKCVWKDLFPNESAGNARLAEAAKTAARVPPTLPAPSDFASLAGTH